MSRGMQLVKNTLIITIGKIATQFVSFILLPFYTSMLTTSEFGLVDMFSTYVQLFLPTMTLLIEQGAFRYLLKSESDVENREIVTSSLILVGLMAILYCIVFTIISPLIKVDNKLFVLLMLLTSAFSSWGLQIARGLKKMHIYAIGSFFTTAIAIAFNVLFIAVFHMGVVGMLMATVISNFFCFVYIILKLRIFRMFDFSLYNKDVLKKMLRYSLPLIPNQISFWVINFSDRTLVNIFIGTAANGILAVSHKFSSVFSSIYGIFQLSWHEMGALHFNDGDRDIFFGDMFAKVYRLFSSVCIGLIAVIPYVFTLLVQENFLEAYYTIPIYLIAVLCNITIGLLGVVYVATMKTGEIAKSTVYSGVISVIVNVLLIKRYGLYAPAIASFVSYFSIMLYRMVDVKKYLNIKYEYSIYTFSALTVALVTGAYYIENSYLNLVSLLIAATYAIIVNRSIIMICMHKVVKIIRCTHLS